MTFLHQLTRRDARHALRTRKDRAAVAPADHTTEAMRLVATHTTAGWNSLRHAC